MTYGVIIMSGHEHIEPGCRCEVCVGEVRAKLLEIMSRIPNAPQKGTTREMERFNNLPQVDDRGVQWYATMYERQERSHDQSCTCEKCIAPFVELYSKLPDYPEEEPLA